jgi:hypothetical protein
LVIALVLSALSSQSDSQADSPLCSMENPGPRGAKVLDLWLQQNGAKTRALPAPLTNSSLEGLGSVLILGVSQRRLGKPEVAQLDAFVRAGGTLVYLPALSDSQPELDDWLKLSRDPQWPEADRRSDDRGGYDVPVTFPRGLLAGAHTLRLFAEPTARTDLEEAVNVASSVVFAIPLEKGEVWLAPGTGLAENRRLELGDNAVFWTNLARRGPVGFDEGHLVAPDTSTARRHLWGVLAQLGFVGLVLLWAVARRLGPPRPLVTAPARSVMEYVRAMANLARRAKVEAELFVELKARVRRVMHEQAGIPLQMETAEAARALEAAGVPLAQELTRLERALPQQVAVDPKLFTELSVAAAKIERSLIGR